MDDVDPTVPAHLQPVLGDAAEDLLVTVTERGWPKDPDERAAHRDDVMRAARVIDLLDGDCCTREQVGALAKHAVWREEPGRWPRTLEEADELLARAAQTRDLILLRDSLGAGPTQEELDEPD
jgi:hypothetical protein